MSSTAPSLSILTPRPHPRATACSMSEAPRSHTASHRSSMGRSAPPAIWPPHRHAVSRRGSRPGARGARGCHVLGRIKGFWQIHVEGFIPQAPSRGPSRGLPPAPPREVPGRGERVSPRKPALRGDGGGGGCGFRPRPSGHLRMASSTQRGRGHPRDRPLWVPSSSLPCGAPSAPSPPLTQEITQITRDMQKALQWPHSDHSDDAAFY